MDQFAPFVWWMYSVTLAALIGYVGLLFYRLRRERDE
ncbi:hypothetical protein DES52_102241 [Deinococcus yavapaiensis KR-236]|uniref:Heme exporter protein D n=1 Tax=Deinococcus yavapaiensis KR-236 TaxID=694435 RepID=A0A318SF50_9DEIO|nr:hypothetical protein DES52_102241 [Deinococcus yavapaiensis KR-236]